VITAVLQHTSGATWLVPKQGESPKTPFLLLGATLYTKIKAMIGTHQYIELEHWPQQQSHYWPGPWTLTVSYLSHMRLQPV